jgi:acyl-CoA synthetase (AMP-forming)/AMP-acid ligase II
MRSTESNSSVPSLRYSDLGTEGFATLAGMLRRRACERPERRTFTFLADGEAREASLTNGEPDTRARAIACMLAERGLHGERLLLLYPPGLEGRS